MNRRSNIHLVEDLDVDFLAFQRAINRGPFADRVHIRRFKNGTEVLQSYVSGQNPDLLFIDVNLGDYSGFEIMERLKSQPNFCLFPKIIYTSSRNPKDVEQCYHLGANGYLVKPLGVQRLAALLDTCLDYWLHCVERPSPLEFRQFG